MKPGSLFNDGLCPVVFSLKQNEVNGQEWIRDGFNIKYYKGDIQRDGNKNKPHYTLTFSYYVNHSNDTLYFAHSFPYTFTDLKEYINSFMKDDVKNKRISVKKLCKTLAGNNCEQLTITSSSMIKRNQRKGIVIFARQHPGETGGSYMMQGCIDFLLGDSPEAEYLRESCVFKIVPMLNPDGVIHGNYRCSLAGCDLNRRWKKPRKKLHPCVYYLKEMIKNFNREREIKLIVDLHGHSRKMNTFFYGCSYKEDPVVTKVFPYMMSKLTDYINFEECRFNAQKSKEKTARISLWKEIRVQNVYTVEASFYGKQQNQVKTHYSIQDYLDIGQNLIINLYNFLWEEETDENKKNRKLNIQMNKQTIVKELKENEQKMNQQDQQKSDSDGSDSDPSEDELPDEQMIKLLPKTVLTKKQKNILAQEEEKAKEKREKELQAKRLQKKNELLQGNQSDTQFEKRKFTITKFMPRNSKIIQDKKPEPKSENQIEMVDVAVQTDASFIMEMKTYLMKKQYLQNGIANSFSMNANLIKSTSLTNNSMNKYQQKFIQENMVRQVPRLMNNSQAKKENQILAYQLQSHQQRQSLQFNVSPNNTSQINTPLIKQIEGNTTVSEKPNGSQTLRAQNDQRFSQSALKLKVTDATNKINLQDESLKERVNYYSQNPKNEEQESNRQQNSSQIMNVGNNLSNLGNQLNGIRDYAFMNSKSRIHQIGNRPNSNEGGTINPNRSSQIKNLLTPGVNTINNISPHTTTNANNNTISINNLPILNNSNTSNPKFIQENNNYASTISLSSPKNDNLLMKKQKSQVNSIIRSGKVLNQNQQNQDFSIGRKQKPTN